MPTCTCDMNTNNHVLKRHAWHIRYMLDNKNRSTSPTSRKESLQSRDFHAVKTYGLPVHPHSCVGKPRMEISNLLL
eukprot:jgi/Botrbrau1/4972/Bobra.0396s0002.1